LRDIGHLYKELHYDDDDDDDDDDFAWAKMRNQ